MRSTVTVSWGDGDPIVNSIRRLTFRGEKTPKAIKRAMSRYTQILNSAETPDFNVVKKVSQILLNGDINLLGGLEYPEPSLVRKAIETAPINDSEIRSLTSYLDNMSFTGYCKLIEAVEQMYVGK